MKRMLTNQLRTLKNNWLLALLIILAILMPQFMKQPIIPFFEKGVAESGYTTSYPGRDMITIDGGFAPEAEERIITKTASATNEIERKELDSKNTNKYPMTLE